eukprot:TRINITY_DN9052_c0_g1_i1.p1 TRINITY_DN9052_c0_g1~~TRINITY_DN9052_c0_g1_i1.p1  ORF type:complete len:150 (-),score=48.06 TRINITY_DN9052_c0_g1_i1:93-542(-)
MANPSPQPSVPVAAAAASPSLSGGMDKEAFLEQRSQVLFDNIAQYVQGELSVVNEDYKMLKDMNDVTTVKYEGMTGTATELLTSMEALQAKYKELQPYLSQIDEIDGSVAELEKTVMELDDYTSRLEAKFAFLKESQRSSSVGLDVTKL